MLSALRRIFALEQTPSELRDGHDLHLAAAVLLIEVSRADYSIAEQELETVAGLLGKRFSLNGEETQALVELARDRSRDAHSLHPFLRRVNAHFDAGEKAQMIEDLWRVAFADGRLDKYEEHQIRRIADLLYVPHSAFIRAKHAALADAPAQGKTKGR